MIMDAISVNAVVNSVWVPHQGKKSMGGPGRGSEYDQQLVKSFFLHEKTFETLQVLTEGEKRSRGKDAVVTKTMLLFSLLQMLVMVTRAVSKCQNGSASRVACDTRPFSHKL